ncbi:MAG TPA: hypothetical protein VGN57_03620 [Pirellulaceae bacterium]|nr:hypothetical protein [Pirellulaceae bacterium]
MFRKYLIPLLIATVAVSSFASVASAKPDGRRPQKHTPWQYFRIFSMTGATLTYTGWQYAKYSRDIALANGYDDGDTQGSFYYGQQYAYYSFMYGFYGYEYGFKDWIVMAGDMAVASKNYEQGIYTYLYNGYYQQYPKQLQQIMDALNGAVGYEDLASKYFYYAVTFVEPQEETEGSSGTKKK